MISVASILGFLLGFQLLFFGLVCSIDFERRYETAKKIGELVKYPGLKFTELFESDQGKNNQPIYLDLQKRVNVLTTFYDVSGIHRSIGTITALNLSAHRYNVRILFPVFFA